jgi:ribosomal protein L37AE/L43A
MNKVEEILKAWAIKLSPSEEQNTLAAARLTICDKCPKKKKNHVGIWTCSECGCVLKVKVFTPVKDGCPLKKW